MGINFLAPLGAVAKFVNAAATTAGHATGTLPKNKHITGVDWGGLDNVTKSIGDTVKKVPVVGPLFHGMLGIETQPFSIAENILKGQRIDHVAVGAFRQRIGDVREVAPYAQTVIAFVPAVGPAASAAIGAGLAIAAGRPADEVAMAAVAGAIPGGAIAQAAYNVGRTALVQHKLGGVSNLVSAIGTAAGVTIPPAANTALTGGLNALQAVANGKKPDQALLQSALAAAPGLAKNIDLSSVAGLQNVADKLVAQGQSMIPNLNAAQRASIKNALHTGIAMQHAQNLQNATTRAVSTGRPLQLLLQAGQKAGVDPVIQAARTALQGKGVVGYDVGTGLMGHQTTPFEVSTVRSPLNAADQHGFDAAAALQIGRVTTPPPVGHPATQAGHAIMHGARTAAADRQVALAGTAAHTSAGAAGAQIAVDQIRAATDRRELWLDMGIVGGAVLVGSLGGLPWALVGLMVGGGVDLFRRSRSKR